MSNDKEKTYCYLDHANKKSENYAANPYLFWLNQVRRQRAERRDRREATEGCDDACPPKSRLG